MAINAKIIVKTPATPAKQQVVEDIKPSTDGRTGYISKNENSLIVNGKKKTISKKSAYLLDMLSLDDE